MILKDSPEVIDHLEEMYRHRPSWLHYFPYPCREFSPSASTAKRSKTSGGTHIVFAGSLHNDSRWHPYPSSPTRPSTPFGCSTDQGIHFSIYNGLDSNGAGYEEYLELASHNPLFEYHFAIAVRSTLPSLLAAHDFGWFCFDYSAAPESPFFHKTTFGSKIFSYVEAGLPVLISPDITYMCSVVESLGIGLPLSFTDIPHLSETLRQTDVNRLLDGVRRAQQELSMDRQIPRIVEFYETSGHS